MIKRAQTVPEATENATLDCTAPFKQPLNAYMLYFYEEICSKKYDTKSVTEAARKILHSWEELPESKRQTFAERASATI